MKNLVKISLVAVSLLTLSNCESRDFGNREPDAVPMSNATWEGGIGTLIQKKCANCHTDSRSEFVPGNTPTHLNTIAAKEFWEEKSNLGLFSTIKHRIGETPDQPMPPTFATPFVGVEKELLQSFIDNQIKQITLAIGPTDPIKNGECKKLPDWDDSIATVIRNNCASTCHADTNPKRKPIGNQDIWLQLRDDARLRIASGNMPPGNKAFKDTNDGKLLLGTLCLKSGEPVQQTVVFKTKVKHVLADGTDVDTKKIVTFNDIKPLLDKSCNSCHGPINESDPNEFDMLDLSQRPLTSKRKDIDNNIPLDTEAKIIAKALDLMGRPIGDFERMPQFGVDPLDIDLDNGLKSWMANGLPDVAPTMPLDKIDGVQCRSIVTVAGAATENPWTKLTKEGSRDYSVVLTALPGADVKVECHVMGAMPENGSWNNTTETFKVAPNVQVPTLEMVYKEAAGAAPVP